MQVVCINQRQKSKEIIDFFTQNGFCSFLFIEGDDIPLLLSEYRKYIFGRFFLLTDFEPFTAKELIWTHINSQRTVSALVSPKKRLCGIYLAEHELFDYLQPQNRFEKETLSRIAEDDEVNFVKI